jgi:hypothetical protein
MANNPINWNDTTPAAPSDGVNVHYQAETPDADPAVRRNASSYVKPGELATTDTTLGGGSPSDAKIPSQKAVKTYIDALLAANDAMIFKGVIDCSANPNYPAADRGWTWRVSLAGKIGGASGPNVEVGDIIICIDDGTASGNHATVGSHWGIIQNNIDGAVVGPASATDSVLALFNGTTGKIIKAGTITEAALRDAGMIFVVDGGGSVPSVNANAYLILPYAATIISWTMINDASGSAQVTISTCDYSGFPTLASIVASAPPSITSARKNQSSTLTGWTTSLAKGTIIKFNLDSIATSTKVVLMVQLQRV